MTVTDANGAPVPGVSVTFTAPAFGPSVYVNPYPVNTEPVQVKTTVVTTDEYGVAGVKAKAGCNAGAVQVTASIGSQSVTFHLTNTGTTPAYCLDPSWTADPLMPGMNPPPPDTPVDTAVEGWWWRDTKQQATLLQHSKDNFTDTVVSMFTSSTINAYVYLNPVGPNVTLFTTQKSYMIVGCAGGRTVNCSFGTIASGGSVTVTIQVNRVNTRVPVVNTTGVASGIIDIGPVDNSATVTTP